MMRWLRRVTVVLIWLAVLMPLAPLMLWSFADAWFFPSLLPERWSWDAWRYVVSPSSRVGAATVTSLGLALTVTLLCIVIGLPAARALAIYNFRGKQIAEWLLMLPIIVPMLVVSMGIHVLFIRYGLTDTSVGVALVHLAPALPYFVLVMAGVFANYSTDLEETARTLGADPLRTFVNVTLPAILPGLLVASMFTFLISWTQYISTLLIGGGRVVTLPMVLFPLIGAANHALAAAVSLVFLLPTLLILVLTTRWLSQDARTLGGFGKL